MAVEIIDLEFEKLLKQAITRELKREINTASTEEFSPSLNFQKQMKKLFKKDKRDNFYKNFIRYSKRAAMYILIIMGLFTALFIVSEDVRANVEIIIEWFEDHIGFQFAPKDLDMQREEFDLKRIPDQYEVILKDDLGAVKLYDLFHKNGHNLRLDITPTSASHGMSIYNIEVEVEVIKLSGNEVMVLIGQGEVEGGMVIWEMDGYRFQIDGAVPMKTLIDLARKIIKNK